MGIRRASVMLLALRFAVRELRGGLRGFYVFIACIALGVMAIAGIGSLASGLADGLAREGRVILGGDTAFALSLREASATERRFLDNQGSLSIAATMRAMARAPDGRTALVELKAVDDAYPLYGAVGLEPSQPLAQVLARRDGVFGAAADPALLVRLDLAPGGRIMIGSRDHRDPCRPRIGARQARRWHRFRPAAARQRSGVARNRAAAARQPGTLALPFASLRERRDRCGGACCDGGRASAIAGSRLGGAHAGQCIARARAQRRTLLAVPYPGRAGCASGRRRRRGQRCQGAPRPPARGDRHAEIAGRDRLGSVHDLSYPGSGARHPRGACPGSRSERHCRSSLRGAWAPRCRCRSRRRCIRATSRLRSSTVCSPRSLSRLWPLGRAHDVAASTLFRDAGDQRTALATPALCRGDGAGWLRAGNARDPASL